jgi:hypothetical protein
VEALDLSDLVALPPNCTGLAIEGSGNLKVPSLEVGDRICLRGTRAWVLIIVTGVPERGTIPLEIRAGVV